MNERLVQWTLLKDWRYLEQCLGIPLTHQHGENIDTEYGVLDFAMVARGGGIIAVELETGITSTSKLAHVEEQLSRYKQITFQNSQPTLVLLFAEDVTPQKLRENVRSLCKQLGVLERTYRLAEVQDRYQQLIDRLIKTVGIPLGPTAAMDVCYLRWMNTLIRPFVEQRVNELPTTVFYSPSGQGIFKSRTVYGVRKRLCEDFELILKHGNQLILSEYGRRFATAMLPDRLVGYSQTPPLSIEQKRILLEVLTNGNLRPCKANIYYFLRFLHITEGAWVPKSTARKPEPEERAFGYWELATALFGKHYAWRTLTDFLAFTCNQCEELGLVERIKLPGDYDRAMLMPLGARILGFMELDLHLKRERIHIPMQPF